MDHIFTFIDDNVADPGDLVSFEAFGTLANNVNYLMDSMPVGSIVPILEGFVGVPTPDPTIWQLCDGAEITNPDSPIRNQPTPDLSSEGGKYLRNYTTVGEIGNYGGSNTKNLEHNHGGATGVTNGNPNGADTDNDNVGVKPHAHPLESDLSEVNYEPAHYVVRHYVKIR